MRGNLNDNQAKIDNADKAARAALERKRKIIMQSKQIAYDMLSELYGLEGQELVDTATIEHTLIGKLTASGMTYDQIAELADDSSADAASDEDDDSDNGENADYQTSFFDNKHTLYSD